MINDILVLLAGWLAGAAANWGADVLPAWSERRAAPRFSIGQYLAPWRRAASDEEPGAVPADREPPRRLRRPLLLQVAVALLFALAWRRFQASPILVGVTWLYATYLLATLVIDLEHRRVLNLMTGPAAVAAFVLSFLPGMPGPVPALLGGAVGLGIFLVISLLGRGKMGAGDVKLAGLIGLMLGFPAVLPALVIGIFLGGLAALALLAGRRAGRKSYMAYAPYLALGAIAMLFRLIGG